MEWTYHITQPFEVDRHPLGYWNSLGAKFSFNPGEIDEVLYCCLVKGYPQYVERVPKNELVAAVWRARGLA